MRLASSGCFVHSCVTVHGRVHVVGSSIVTAYSIVFASRRVQPLDEVQVLARALEVGLRREVGHVDDQRLAFPPAARVAPPLPDARGQVRRVGDRDDALPPLALAGVVEDRDRVGRLDDLREEAGRATEVGQHGRHAALAQRPILGPSERLMAPPPAAPVRRDSTGGTSARRGDGGPYFPPSQPGSLFLQTSVACRSASWNSRISCRRFCRLRGQRRNAPVRRIGDERRPPSGRLVGQEDVGAVGAADVLLAAAIVTPDVLTDDGGALLVKLGTLFVGEEFLVGEPRRPLQRDLVGVGPDALQVRRAPRCSRRGPASPRDHRAAAPARQWEPVPTETAARRRPAGPLPPQSTGSIAWPYQAPRQLASASGAGSGRSAQRSCQ